MVLLLVLRGVYGGGAVGDEGACEGVVWCEVDEGLKDGGIDVEEGVLRDLWARVVGGLRRRGRWRSV